MSSSTAAFGTVTGSSYGISITPAQTEKAPRTPAGLIVTQAVQTKDGWLGQVIVDKSIVWESPAQHDGETAIQDANERVVVAVRTLFELVDAAEATARPGELD